MSEAVSSSSSRLTLWDLASYVDPRNLSAAFCRLVWGTPAPLFDTTSFELGELDKEGHFQVPLKAIQLRVETPPDAAPSKVVIPPALLQDYWFLKKVFGSEVSMKTWEYCQEQPDYVSELLAYSLRKPPCLEEFVEINSGDCGDPEIELVPVEGEGYLVKCKYRGPSVEINYEAPVGEPLQFKSLFTDPPK